MSTAEITAAAAAVAAQYEATLVRGRFYDYAGQEFHRDVPRAVDAATKAYLEENAYDVVTVEDEGEHQHWPKFRFTEAKAADEKPAAPRQRSR